MHRFRISRRLAGLIAIACVAGTAAPALAFADPSTGFTYQGSLSQNGTPVTGLRDMRFRLYDAETGGSPIATVQAFDVDIAEGLFSVEVDFGAGPWAANDQLWVEIEAGPADQSQSYEIIGRQKLTATPFALNTRGIKVEANNNITVGATLQLENPSQSTWAISSTTKGRFAIRDTSVPDTRFLIDADGNVGIGTTFPARRLHISDGFSFAENTIQPSTTLLVTTQDSGISLVSDNSGAFGSFFDLVELDGAGTLVDKWTMNRRTPVGASALEFRYGTTANVGNNAVVMSMLPNGNVGIGTDSAARLLHLDDGFDLGPNTIQPNTDLLITSQDAGFTMVSDQSGSVGSFLDLMEQDGAGTLIDNWSMIRRTPAENSRLEFRYGPNPGASANNLVMSMQPNGNVGIGTASPSTMLEVRGSFSAEDSQFNGDVRLGYVNQGTEDTLFVNRIVANPRAGSTSPDALRINAGGVLISTIVGVGSTFSNGEAQLVVKADNDPFRTSIFKALTPAFIEALDVRTNGQVFCSGGLICASDERLKHDIRTIISPLDSVLALRGVTFDWNADHPAAAQGEQIGFIAQEVERVLPQLVEEGPDGIKAMNYANLTAVLVEAVKEQQAGIVSRDARIDDLEARLVALEARAESAERPGLFGASALWPVALVGGVGGVGGLALASRRDQSRSERRRG